MRRNNEAMERVWKRFSDEALKVFTQHRKCIRNDNVLVHF